MGREEAAMGGRKGRFYKSTSSPFSFSMVVRLEVGWWNVDRVVTDAEDEIKD